MTDRSGDLAAAVDAVRAAARACRAVQQQLAEPARLQKGDKSPVTVADFASQAIVCATLEEALPDDAVVGEEDAASLREAAQAALLAKVVARVAAERGPTDAGRVLDWIDRGNADARSSRYWTLDPIDGTKGFLRGEQYAIALALIEHGEVVLGVLGCPNYPLSGGRRGATFVAAHGQTHLSTAGKSTRVTTVPPASLDVARFCESVESGHSDQAQSAQIAAELGMTAEPYRIDSQCKYGAIALSDAHVYLRLPTRADYVEKIWDHAAGKLVVEYAGGRVTDVNGAPLDFSKGARLTSNSGVIATSGRFHDEVVAAVGTVLH